MLKMENRKVENNLARQDSSNEAQPHGRIQKISQEGSKSTYMIILRKDYLKSDYKDKLSQKESPDLSKQDSGDLGYDSPVGNVCIQRKQWHKSDDMKLNDSVEYDSSKSAGGVFPNEDSGVYDQEVVLNETDRSSFTAKCENLGASKAQISSYVIQSPLGANQAYRHNGEQHSFSNSSSNNPSELHQQSSVARKIVLMTPSPWNRTSKSLLKKSVNFIDEAVPAVSKSSTSSVKTDVSLQGTSSTCNNASPVCQINSAKVTAISSSIVSVCLADQTKISKTGPQTSTPVSSSTESKSRFLLDSTPHRPVYVIPSPFSRQRSTASQPASSTPSGTFSKPSLSLYDATCTRTPCSVNSSGWASSSASLEITSTQSSTSAKISPGEKPCSDGSGGVVIRVEDGSVEEIDLGVDAGSLTSSQESTSILETGTVLNRSLTNIQWLKGMQLKEDKPQTTQNQLASQYQNVQWTSLTPSEIMKITGEFNTEKRPPFSYMTLIQMALCSQKDRRMMLKEICKWIEKTFPYYKNTSKRGWKNSIRHNLSLYNIFERESGKRHGAYWTIRSNVEPRTKHYQRSKPGDAFSYNFPFTIERGRSVQRGISQTSTLLRNRSNSRERGQDVSRERGNLASGAPVPKEGENLLERLTLFTDLYLGNNPRSQPAINGASLPPRPQRRPNNMHAAARQRRFENERRRTNFTLEGNAYSDVTLRDILR